MLRKNWAARRRVIYFNRIPPRKIEMWAVYILECADGTFYTGVTKNLDRRIHEHNNTKKGAKYTRSRRPVHLLASVLVNSASEALKLERSVKKQKRNQKVTFLLEYKQNG
tara:strand:+ start:840 stop:1169 length:330 start_codon:yes stop_codon:yes gene_type:complete